MEMKFASFTTRRIQKFTARYIFVDNRPSSLLLCLWWLSNAHLHCSLLKALTHGRYAAELLNSRWRPLNMKMETPSFTDFTAVIIINVFATTIIDRTKDIRQRPIRSQLLVNTWAIRMYFGCSEPADGKSTDKSNVARLTCSSSSTDKTGTIYNRLLVGVVRVCTCSLRFSHCFACARVCCIILYSRKERLSWFDSEWACVCVLNVYIPPSISHSQRKYCAKRETHRIRLKEKKKEKKRKNKFQIENATKFNCSKVSKVIFNSSSFVCREWKIEKKKTKPKKNRQK